MKVLVLGANGFVGRNVAEAFSADSNYEVYRASRDARPDDEHAVSVNLEDKKAVQELIVRLKPEIVVNCAGIVDPSKDFNLNEVFTRNILGGIVAAKYVPERIIISGSASEYGEVGEAELPVDEDTPLGASSGYGLSKRNETSFAREYAKEHHLPLVVARIFNPLGPAMQERFLTSRLIQQFNEIKSGRRDNIEVNRADARRDYIDVRDVARAIKTLAENKPRYDVYNVGSGVATSTRHLVDVMSGYNNIDHSPLVETSASPEPIYAIQADIARITNEFGWRPQISLNQTVEDIIKDANNEN
jgi:GDP-4-dehydro-6-deoxy-D-mannose reductase